MKKNNDIYLNDILQAFEKIEFYLEKISFSDFLADEIRQDAVIRQLCIIGEAANKLSSDFINSQAEVPFREAIAMRHMLVHGYDQVNIRTIWKTIQSDLPDFKTQVFSLILKN